MGQFKAFLEVSSGRLREALRTASDSNQSRYTLKKYSYKNKKVSL
jgi:hypothetical protein